MTVRQTSREAFVQLASHEAIRLQILRHLRDAGERPLCRKQIAAMLGKPFHAVSGRFTELRDSGLIDDEGTGRVIWDGRSHARLLLTAEGLAAANADRTARGGHARGVVGSPRATRPGVPATEAAPTLFSVESQSPWRS